MKFRTRLLVAFVGLAVVSGAVLLAVQYAQSSRQLRRQIETTVLSIATTAARGVDAERLATLRAPADQDSAAYRDLERSLRAVRDDNRRRDVHVKFVYTLHRDPLNPATVRFGVDAEEPGPDKSNLGDVYEVPAGFVFNADAPLVFPKFSTDAWGTWLTAQAPIQDQAGRTVGLLGVDVAADEVIAAEHGLLVSGVLSVSSALLLAVLLAGFLATRVSRPLAVLRDALSAIGAGRYDTVVRLAGAAEFQEVGAAVNDMAVGLLQRENLKGALARYVSAEVTQTVLEEGEVRLVGERRRVTILFADLRGFTALAERTPPEEVVAMLNDFYAGMIGAVMAHGGFLNKFLGDGLMAVFGAPRVDDAQEVHAVGAALAMQRAIRTLRDGWRRRPGRFAGAELQMGIGIHAGEAVVGNVGSAERVEYTAIGDTVNLASRLEGATKELGVEVLVSDAVYRGARGVHGFQPMGRVAVRGTGRLVTAYAPLRAPVAR